MTDRATAVLALLAGQLEQIRRDSQVKRYMVADAGKLSTATVHWVWHGHDCRVSTLVAIADGLDCDVEIVIKPRSVNQTRPT